MNRVFSERGRFALGLVPMVLVFLAAEVLLLTGNQSFSGPLSFIGVVVIAMQYPDHRLTQLFKEVAAQLSPA